ncbi:low temperature requirement protein A [Actinoplanes sp. M2I2]|uniref:low temperature requirement protein A n=1 Tax=Actinoplanes sp. M2I2 TaxID=1734444 RepID=UPI00202238C3|nr:low temperature requirement protein A [Actinoplanes sp. M2I2]
MRARSATEPHRTATPLELFFDLCFVVAVAQAALPLHHAIAEDHVAHGVGTYLIVFFAIWWAWMNFTWFASAYDTDDDVYRITTLVQIAGVLVLAAGVEAAFEDGNFTAAVIGFVIMRLALVAQWVRAARSDPDHRSVAVRYAFGVVVVQVLWLGWLTVPGSWSVPLFVVLALAELLVPALAEYAPGGPTTYHPHHVAERYGLFTIIMLGEAVAATTIAVKTGLAEGEHLVELAAVAASGLVLVFALWWLYFDRPARRLTSTPRVTLVWGYGHYLIFAAAAAVGAGLGVVVDYETHHAEVSGVVAGYAIAVPVVVFLLAVWLLHVRPAQTGAWLSTYPITAALVLLAPLGPAPVTVIALLLVALVVLTVSGSRRGVVTAGIG